MEGSWEKVRALVLGGGLMAHIPFTAFQKPTGCVEMFSNRRRWGVLGAGEKVTVLRSTNG